MAAARTTVVTEEEARTAPWGAVLPRPAFLGPPDAVAPYLLGKMLVRRAGDHVMAGRIVETEAYFGEGDPAAHAFAGRTARTEVLFGPPGHAYVYLIYGLHACLNVSCEPAGQAGCVLIRALEPLAGLNEMAGNRGLGLGVRAAQLTAGPGRLCAAMAISRAEHNGMDLTDEGSGLRICEPGGVDCGQGEIAVTARVGVNKAAERQLRFILKGNGCVSRGKFWKAVEG